MTLTKRTKTNKKKFQTADVLSAVFFCSRAEITGAGGTAPVTSWDGEKEYIFKKIYLKNKTEGQL